MLLCQHRERCAKTHHVRRIKFTYTYTDVIHVHTEIIITSNRVYARHHTLWLAINILTGVCNDGGNRVTRSTGSIKVAS